MYCAGVVVLDIPYLATKDCYLTRLYLVAFLAMAHSDVLK